MRKRNQKKLTKFLLPLVIVALVVMLLGFNFMNKRKGQVIAKVNGEKIYKSEVDLKLREIFNDQTPDQFKIEKLPQEMVISLVKDIYAQRKLDKEIKKSNLIKRADIKAKIDDYAKKITRNEYLEKAIKDKVSEQAVKDKYVELINNLTGKREVQIRHILVKTKSDAENILKQIKNKKSFADLASKYSIDEISAKEGGNLGYVFEDNMIPEFFDFVNSAKKGEVSNPIETNYGWHIIKVENFKDAEIPPFESVRSMVEERIRKEEIHKVFSGLTENAKVKILINLQSADHPDAVKSIKLEDPDHEQEDK